MTAEGATFPGQDTPDTAALRAALHEERSSGHTQNVDCWACEAGRSSVVLALLADNAKAWGAAQEVWDADTETLAERDRAVAALDAATARAEELRSDLVLARNLPAYVDMVQLAQQRNAATAERDRARGTAALLEAEVARLEHDRAHPYGELAESGEPR